MLACVGAERYVPPLLAVVRLLELYVAAVEDGRPVPEGIREYLRRAGWLPK